MPAIKIESFDGISPRTGPALLSGNQAQIARNVKLQSGELRPWRKEVLIEPATTANAISIYKMDGPAGASKWLSWSVDVDVVASPLADTSDFRVYYTGHGTPKKTNWAMATTGTGPFPAAYYEMGVPAPTGAPTLSASGGTGSVETRSYLYTYVSTFGSVKEESAPSPAALVNTLASGSTVTVNGFTAPPAGAYNITHRRIYRAVTGASETVYLQVAEIPIGTSSFADNLSVTALGAELISLDYNVPPADMKGIVSMANGMLAAFTDNSVYFCEPYLPHAWPAKYVMNTEHKIVGLGVFGTTLVVCTTKHPYLITGTHPATLSQEKLSMSQACVSKRSIAYDHPGVVYASPYGLVYIGAGSQDVVTTPVITTDDWENYSPTSMLGVLYGNFYIGFHDHGDERHALVLARGEIPAMSVLVFPATAIHLDRSTGKMYACSSVDNSIYLLDGNPDQFNTFEWKSKQFVMARPVNFAALQANADFTNLTDLTSFNAQVAAVIAANASIWSTAIGGNLPLGGEWNIVGYNQYMWNNSSLEPLPTQPDVRSVNIIIYADGKQAYSGGIYSIEPRRLPAGFKASVWEITVTGNAPVRSVYIATSVGELAAL